MKIRYDKEVDVMYVQVKKAKISKTVPITDQVIVDFDKRGGVVGIEMLDVSLQLSKEKLKKLRSAKPTRLLQAMCV